MPISLRTLAIPSGTHLNVQFSERQLQILNLLAMGYNRKEMGFILHVCVKTINAHMDVLAVKFKTDSRDKILIEAIVNRVVDPMRLNSRERDLKDRDFVDFQHDPRYAGQVRAAKERFAIRGGLKKTPTKG